jgi:hypothetical protein
MNDPVGTLSRLLTDVLLPTLRTVQISQTEQIAANDKLEKAIEDLRVHLEAQFAQLSAELTACRAELAATHAALQAAQGQKAWHSPDRTTLIH